MKTVVVVEPEVPENTGFIARLCSNFGFELRIVNPDFNLSDCRSTAQNAQEVLRNSRIYDNFEEAIIDLDFLIGTKPGKGVKSREFSFRDNTSIVLGRESSGLTNSELEKCDAVVHIETSGYESVNLSHAAAVLMHQASSSNGEAVDNGRLDVLEERSGPVLRDIIARGSPTDKELDSILKELV